MRRVIAIFLFALIGLTAEAQTPPVSESEMQIELQAREIGRSLRCVVCQNQSIDDSDAPLAKDMRALVRQRLRQGEDEAQIIAYMQEIYGDYVLLKPPVKPSTYLLWAGPFLMLLGGMFWMFTRRRNPAKPVLEAPLTAQERAALNRLLAGEDDI